jgi:hypothetical protein
MLVLVLAVIAVAAQPAVAQDAAAKRLLFEEQGSPTQVIPRNNVEVRGNVCFTQNIAGATSNAFEGDASNIVLSPDVSPCTVDDISWVGVTLTTFAPSWADEPRIKFSASDGSDAAYLQVAFTATTVTNLPIPDGNLGSSVNLLGDNVLRMEFFESGFDDISGPDAVYPTGDLEVRSAVVPVELSAFEVE